MTSEGRHGRRYQVYGRVQGVGFRYFVSTVARELDLDGWVENRPDGSVEVVAAGPAERLEELANRLRVGPPAARVDEVAEEPAEVRGRGFGVRFQGW